MSAYWVATDGLERLAVGSFTRSRSVCGSLRIKRLPDDGYQRIRPHVVTRSPPHTLSLSIRHPQKTRFSSSARIETDTHGKQHLWTHGRGDCPRGVSVVGTTAK